MERSARFIQIIRALDTLSQKELTMIIEKIAKASQGL